MKVAKKVVGTLFGLSVLAISCGTVMAATTYNESGTVPSLGGILHTPYVVDSNQFDHYVDIYYTSNSGATLYGDSQDSSGVSGPNYTMSYNTNMDLVTDGTPAHDNMRANLWTTFYNPSSVSVDFNWTP